jgi:hypothetical protein
MKRLKTKTTVKNTGQAAVKNTGQAAVKNTGQAAVKNTGQAAADPPPFHFVGTRLDALLPAILDRAFKGGL